MEKERLTDELGSVATGNVSAPEKDENQSTYVGADETSVDNNNSSIDSTDSLDTTEAPAPDPVNEAVGIQTNGSAINNNAEETEPEPTIPESEGELNKTEDEPVADSASGEEQEPQEVIENSETKEEQVQEVPEVENQEPAQEEELDYTKLDKEELLNVLLELVRSDDMLRVVNKLKEIKTHFDIIYQRERQEAFDKYLEEGGEKDGFEYQPDESTQKFHANYQLLWDRRQKYFKELEKQKEHNLEVKNEILEELRELVDGEETVTSIKVIKQIQEKWKSTGPIPRQHNKTLWANYHALLDRFYDNRSIYFELKELDRKKNLELKIELCEKAEALVTEDLQKAIQELNGLHEEFKHIGPVPLDSQEELWIRFKAASDSIYAKRKVYIEEIKDQLQLNFVEKSKLCEEIEAFTEFTSDRITKWNDKTKEIQELQKRWEKIGGLPRDKSKSINRKFWSSFKTFFANKSKFFKTLEGQKDENLKLKEKLVERAEELKSSNDLVKTVDVFKKMQQEWREIGPVPEKVKNEIYKRFKSACDEFFDRKRASIKESEKEFEENQKRKEAICDQLEEIVASEKIDLDMVETLQTQYGTIGFVPRSSLKKMNKRYDYVLNALKEKLEGSDLANKDQIALEIDIRKLQGTPGAGRQMQKQENNLRRQITAIENNISTWKNNLEFFRDSKTADKFKKEFDVKIDEANEELKQLRKQLKMMESA